LRHYIDDRTLVNAVKIYNRIDDFSEENKRKIALALKAYWKVNGKWEKGRAIASKLGMFFDSKQINRLQIPLQK